MTNQDEIRDEVKHYVNSIRTLAQQWNVDEVYLHRWYKGQNVGEAVLARIKSGLAKMKDKEKINEV